MNMKPPKWFSDELSAIFGRLMDGRPNLRVIWGDDPDFFVLRMDGEKVPRYPAYRSERFKGFRCYENGEQLPGLFTQEEAANYLITYPVLEVHYRGIRQWVLEGWNSAERLVPGWNSRRWDTDYDPPVDVLGPPPKDGDYDFIKFLDVLNDEALNRIRHLAAVAVNDPLHDSYFQRRMATKDEIAASVARDDLLEAEYEAKKAAETRAMIVSNLLPMGKFLFNSRPNQGGGKMGYRTTKR